MKSLTSPAILLYFLPPSPEIKEYQFCLTLLKSLHNAQQLLSCGVFCIGIGFCKAAHPLYASFHMRLSSLASDIAFLILLTNNICGLFFFFLLHRERCGAVLNAVGAVHVCGCLCFAVLEVRGDALSLYNEEELVAGSLLTVGSVLWMTCPVSPSFWREHLVPWSFTLLPRCLPSFQLNI